MEQTTNGKLLILQYKYGEKDDMFDSYQKTLELVEQYPILYTVIPQEYRDKQMTLTFVKKNSLLRMEYQEIIDKIKADEFAFIKQGIACTTEGLHKPYLERENTLMKNGIVDGLVNLGDFTKDVEVLSATMNGTENGSCFVESVGGFTLTPETYDEETVKTVMKSYGRMACRVYCYWLEYIEQFPKVCDFVKVKYQLYNQPSASELALYKCLSMIDKNNKNALDHLFQTYTINNFESVNQDHIEVMKKVFDYIDIDLQNELCKGDYRYVRYMKVANLDEDLQKVIVKKCGIAGDILPDKTVIMNNLAQSVSDEQSKEKCKKCNACSSRHYLYV